MRTFILLVIDAVLFFSALFIALWVRTGEINLDGFYAHIIPFMALFLCYVFGLYLLGMYDKHYVVTKRGVFNALIFMHAVLFVGIVILFYFMPLFGITPKTNLLIFLGTFFVFHFIWRAYGIRFLHTSGVPVFLIGSDKVLESVFSPRRISHINIVDTYPANVSVITLIIEAKKRGVKTIVFDFSEDALQHFLAEYTTLLSHGFTCIDTRKIKEEFSGRVVIDCIDERWILEYAQTKSRWLFMYLKRVFDIIIVVMLVPVCIIIFPFVMLGIKLTDGGPIFFKQERLGLYGVLITIYKFRTMSGIDTGVEAIKSTHTVTSFGKFLRRTRIDELPQLWNVFLGNLALIGPRPEIKELAQEYQKVIPYYHARHLVRPGLTGWAQVTHTGDPHHQVDISATKEKLSYDLYYIKYQSMFLELKIILKTIRIVLTRIIIFSKNKKVCKERK